MISSRSCAVVLITLKIIGKLSACLLQEVLPMSLRRFERRQPLATPNYNGSSESFLTINSTLLSSILLEPCCRDFSTPLSRSVESQDSTDNLPCMSSSTKTSNHQHLSQASMKSQRTSIWYSQLFNSLSSYIFTYEGFFYDFRWLGQSYSRMAG